MELAGDSYSDFQAVNKGSRVGRKGSAARMDSRVGVAVRTDFPVEAAVRIGCLAVHKDLQAEDFDSKAVRSC